MIPLLVCFAVCVNVISSQSMPKNDTRDGRACGGMNADPFDHYNYYLTHGLPTAFEVRSGDNIDGLQMYYAGVAAPFVGGEGGTAHSYTLGEDDIIAGIAMRQIRNPDNNWVVCQLSFYVSGDGVVNEIGPFGECLPESMETHYCGTYISTQPMQYIRGQAGDLIDYLEAVFDLSNQ